MHFTIAVARSVLVRLGVIAALGSVVACGDAVADDLGADLASEAGCGDACTADSDVVGARYTLSSLAHGVAGELVVVNDGTLLLEAFDYDGGGVDVRALVAPDRAGLGDDTVRTMLSEDLRRAGGYAGASLTFNLPEGMSLDDIGVFAIWCLPFGANFGDAVINEP